MTDRPGIRRACPEDLPELLDLCADHAAYERQGFTRGDQLECWPAMLFEESGSLNCWVVENQPGRSEKLLGFASCSLEAATWSASQYVHLDCIYLRPEARGDGVGLDLMRRVVRHALDLGCTQVQWQTPVWNQRAARFYYRLGAVAQHKLRFALPADACRQLVAGDLPAAQSAPVAGGYAPRPVTPLGVDLWEGWSIKLYSLSADGSPAPDEQVEEARRRVRSTLPEGAQDDGRFGMAFALLHAGTEANWLLVDWWTEGGILRQRLLAAPLDRPLEYQAVHNADLHACVWEMAVIDHERRAWVETVMANPDGPDFGAYLGRVMETAV
ncbi:MAG: GNAT family N-acetyltransferase [Acidobacteriota bacterium]